VQKKNRRIFFPPLLYLRKTTRQERCIPTAVSSRNARHPGVDRKLAYCQVLVVPIDTGHRRGITS